MPAADDFEEETRLLRADIAAVGAIRAGGTMAEAVRAAIKAYKQDLVPDAATGGFPLRVPSDLHDPEELNREDTLASIEDLPDPAEPRYPFDG